MSSHVMDRLFTYLIWGAVALLTAAFLWLLGHLVWQGVPHL